MAFKTLTIDSPAELHVHKGQSAARIYFPMLSPGYTRDSVCPLTSALNYGYAARGPG